MCYSVTWLVGLQPSTSEHDVHGFSSHLGSLISSEEGLGGC